MKAEQWEILEAQLPAICRDHKVALVYLFGSQAEGFEDPFSDVDLGVVFFDSPSDTNRWERWQKLSAALEPLVVPKQLDLIFLQLAPVLVQWQAISQGKLLYCADEEFRMDFEEQVIGEWLDFGEWLKWFQRDMIEGILERRDNA